MKYDVPYYGKVDKLDWRDASHRWADYINHLPECNAYLLNSKECDCGGRELAKGLRSGELIIAHERELDGG